MIESRYYESNLQLGSTHYDLDKVKPILLEWFKQNSRPVSEYHPPANHDMWDFHSRGVSIHLQTTELTKGRLHFVDVRLISEVTPTQDLEDRLNGLVEPFKK